MVGAGLMVVFLSFFFILLYFWLFFFFGPSSPSFLITHMSSPEWVQHVYYLYRLDCSLFLCVCVYVHGCVCIWSFSFVLKTTHRIITLLLL